MDQDNADGASVSRNGTVERITLGMGCFWSPEALFGSMPGVLRTRTGYAGGTTDEPTYREMGDHTECVQLAFDAGAITFEELVEIFWERHRPVNINGYKGRQYQSLLFYENEYQRTAIDRVLLDRERGGLGRPETEVVPYSVFYTAEERHQKYYLKRYPQAIEALTRLYPSHGQLNDSALAARLNGLAKGYTNMERIKREIGNWRIDDTERGRMLDAIASIRW